MTSYADFFESTGHMLPLIAATPGALLRQIAHRAVARRLALGWTREELAKRTGIAVDTLKRFEQTGQVSLERLIKVALALDALREFTTLFPESAPASIADLEARAAARGRRRGRSRGRRATADPAATQETPDVPERHGAPRPTVGEAVHASGISDEHGDASGPAPRATPLAPDAADGRDAPTQLAMSDESTARRSATRRRRARREAPDASP